MQRRTFLFSGAATLLGATALGTYILPMLGLQKQLRRPAPFLLRKQKPNGVPS